MDRYVLIPTTREVSVNRAVSESADDLFAYTPDTQALARSRGYLFVVGHTDQESGTVGYLVSLIAALAKREYYGADATDAKAAFGQTLRKINEVVEEFSKSDDVKIDVGLFAVAGQDLLVSRLGRFRILLARDGGIVDVLKDVGTFSKEHVEKKRFSSIISGPVGQGDRIMAYFPHKALASRERAVKQHLLGDSSQAVAAHLASVGKRTKTFSCSALVVDLSRTAITADEPKVAEPVPTLTWTPRQSAAAPVAGDHAVPGEAEPQPEVPRIIASEFSHGSRSNPFTSLVRLVGAVRLGTVGKFVAVGVIGIALVGSLWGARTLFVTDERGEHIASVLRDAERFLTDARASFDAGDHRAARATVLSQLENLNGLTDDTRDGDKLSQAYAELLDEVDSATPGVITLATAIDPADGAPFSGIAASGSETFWVVSVMNGGGASVLTVADDAVIASDPLDGAPDFLVSADSQFVGVGRAERLIALYSDGDVIESVLPTPDEPLDAAWYADSVYVLTKSSILKVSDVDTSKPVTKQWLADESDLAPDSIALAVDGDVWTLSRDGTLTRYYRGSAEESALLPFGAHGEMRLLTTPDASRLFITDTVLKRIYVVDKESMGLERSISIDTAQTVRDIFLAPDQTSFLFITEDGKVWHLR